MQKLCLLSLVGQWALFTRFGVKIKSSEVEELSAQIDQLTSASARLSEEITDLADALSEIKAKQSEATKLRSTEKATNIQHPTQVDKQLGRAILAES